MRVVFAGTPPFAARALEALLDAGHEVALVLTQPDRPAGRGLRPVASAVSVLAASRGLVLHKPATLRDPALAAPLAAVRPDVIVVAAYGLILPQAVLDLPPRGCLNIHASLLPRWRGAAPIQRAILAGDTLTGITIMGMEAGLDTGPALLTRTHEIGPRETAGSLTEALSGLGARCIVEALASIDALPRRPQDEAQATYAAKIAKAEARLDWSLSAAQIDRRVRAFDPVPGAETRFGGETIKVWEAHPDEGQGRPGEVLEASPAGIRVGCGEGALRVVRLQRPGGRRLDAGPFLQGFPIRGGQAFEADRGAGGES